MIVQYKLRIKFDSDTLFCSAMLDFNFKMWDHEDYGKDDNGSRTARVHREMLVEPGTR